MGQQITAAYTGFCGSGAGRKASVIFCTTISSCPGLTFTI